MATVLRGGRTSSEISIYDYPEHLNPFYEDENHKRIRFWTIGKKKKNGRSNSFSLDGIKDFWPLKGFKLKKKSSTLGINKTSESPPVLRRHYDTTQYSYDERMRHTTDPYGSDVFFQRGAGYRSSLQDVNRDLAFQRNNRYRSTVANGSIAAMYNPHHSSRLSQTSLNSTNPFEDDYESPPQSSSTPRKQAADTISVTSTMRRKKRRAPAPPSGNTSTKSIENSNDQTSLECNEIKDLAAEIESFVKISETDSSDISRPVAEEKTQNQIMASNETKDEINRNQGDQWSSETVKVIVTVHDSNHEGEKEDDDEQPTNDEKEIICRQNANESNEKRIIASSHIEETISGQRQLTNEKGLCQTVKSKESKQSADYTSASHNNYVISKALEDSAVTANVVVVEKKIRSERQTTVKPHINELSITEDSDDDIVEIRSTAQNSTPLPKSPATVELEYPINELKITESEEELSEFAKSPTEFSKFVHRFSSETNVNNKSDDFRTTDNNGSDADINRPEVPRRRSVKDIIESINKSQSLLKVNKEYKPDPRCDELVTGCRQPLQGSSSESLTTRRNLTEIHEQEKKMRSLIEKMESEKDEDNMNIPVFVERLHKNSVNNNNINVNDDLFKKCSPLKVGLREWNPVPKPRRSKNFDEKP